MNTYIVIGSENARQQYLTTVIRTHSIKPYHITQLTERIKIADIRKIKMTLAVKTGKQEKRLFVLSTHMTTEAQNAFLKTLEEVNEEVIIVISGDRKDGLLPTILSRVHVVSLTRGEDKTSGSDKSNPEWEFPEFRLQQYQDLNKIMASFNMLASDEDMKQFLLSVRKYIFQLIFRGVTPSSSFLLFYTKLLEQYPLTQQNNINRRLLVESLFLSHINFH